MYPNSSWKLPNLKSVLQFGATLIRTDLFLIRAMLFNRYVEQLPLISMTSRHKIYNVILLVITMNVVFYITTCPKFHVLCFFFLFCLVAGCQSVHLANKISI